jgi:hypothetical protein
MDYQLWMHNIFKNISILGTNNLTFRVKKNADPENQFNKRQNLHITVDRGMHLKKNLIGLYLLGRGKLP